MLTTNGIGTYGAQNVPRSLLKRAPLMRVMILALHHAEENGGIGWTKSGAVGHIAPELFKMNKPLSEPDVPPLWPLHDLVRCLKLLRQQKGLLWKD